MENNVICPRGASRYTWREGDSLLRVALDNGVTEQAIRLANEGRNLNALSPGEEICVPPRQLSCVSGDLYTVSGGDSFFSIAQAFGISTLELAERNPYVDPNDLVPGQVLCVPATPAIPVPPIAPEPSPPVQQPNPPAQRPTPACPTGYARGSVRLGDSYTDLLLRYNVSYAAMRLTNPSLPVDRLTPGTAFCVPPTGTRALCGAGRSYVVAAGENLQAVAERFSQSVGSLLRQNPNLAPSDFVPGRVVCVASRS